jgi:hypothetical protein
MAWAPPVREAHSSLVATAMCFSNGAVPRGCRRGGLSVPSAPGCGRRRGHRGSCRPRTRPEARRR